MKQLARFLMVAATIFAIPLAAQDINGVWITEFERSMRNRGGEVSTADKARAKIVLQQKGDSLIGTWELLNPLAGAPTQSPRQLRGTISGSKGTLQTEIEARRTVNGEESIAKLTIVYDFVVSADKLEGTSTTKSPDIAMAPRPFSAWRDKP